MSDYSRQLGWAKDRVTQSIVALASNDERRHEGAIAALPGDIDDLNKAWDALTDCLVRQREERDRVMLSLIDQLAEAKKART